MYVNFYIHFCKAHLATSAAFFGTGTTEVLGTVILEANKPAQLVLQFASSDIARSKGIPESEFDSLLPSRGGCRFGGGPAFTVYEGIQAAVEAAKEADVAIAVIGLNNGE
jgi:hypothetical protein